jgi:DNA-binding response OmpR family regulator
MLTDKELDEEEYEEIIDAGVDDYFLKPLSGEKILLHLRKGLRQRNISLQKKRLEQELNRIQTKAEVQYSTS